MYCTVKIKNQVYNCYYETNGKITKKPLVLLHGWGVNSKIYNNLINDLDYYVIVIDFIGFGHSDMPLRSFTLDDYVDQLEQIIKYLNLENITLVGHSFGGRVAIKYNYYYNLKNLVLVDTAGIRHRSIDLYKKIYKYKILKKYYFLTNKTKYEELLSNSGSRDYKVLTPIMKQTMNNIIKEDLRKYCKKTRTKTIILWGLKDNETPINDGYKFYKIFYNSRIIIFYRSAHFPFLDEKEKFIRIINCVINE